MVSFGAAGIDLWWLRIMDYIPLSFVGRYIEKKRSKCCGVQSVLVMGSSLFLGLSSNFEVQKAASQKNRVEYYNVVYLAMLYGATSLNFFWIYTINMPNVTHALHHKNFCFPELAQPGKKWLLELVRKTKYGILS